MKIFPYIRKDSVFPIVIFSALAMVLNLGCSNGNESTDSLHIVDEMFNNWDRDDHPGGIVGIIRDGDVIYERSFGMANIDLGYKITEKTLFNLTRQSLPFTGACIIHAARSGLLSLDEDVRQYLPELPEYSYQVTIRHLLHHTSGIVDYQQAFRLLRPWSTDTVFSEDDALRFLSNYNKLDFKPGDEANFSQSNYFLLGLIIKRATGVSLSKYAEMNIFKPLGMQNTYFYESDRDVDTVYRAAAYRYNERDKIEPYEYAHFDIVGDMGLWSTLEDLYIWERKFYNNKLGDGFVDQMLETGILNDGSKTDYAAGIQIGEYKGQSTYNHSGWFMGYQANIVRFPQLNVSIIFLSNLRTGGPINRVNIPAGLADIYLMKDIQNYYNKFEGMYYSEVLGGGYEIFLDGVDLVLRREGSEDAILTHDREFWRPTRIIKWPPDFHTYEANDPALSRLYITFKNNENGSITGLLAERRPRTRNVWFEKTN